MKVVSRAQRKYFNEKYSNYAEMLMEDGIKFVQEVANVIDPRVLIPITVLILLGRIDSKNPRNIWLARLFFVTVLSFVLSVWYNVYVNIKKSKERTFTVVSPETGREDTISAKEYDLMFLEGNIKKLALPRTLILVGHIFLGILKPLVVSSVVALVFLYDEPLIRIYLFGEKEGREPLLTRPFDDKAGLVKIYDIAMKIVGERKNKLAKKRE